MKAGILLFADGCRYRYRHSWDLSQPVGGHGTPLEILASRFSGLPGVDEVVLLAPAGSEWEPLAAQAARLRLPVHRFDLSAVLAKPVSATQERWQLESDSGADSWIGSAIAGCVASRRWDRLVLVPLTNLLVDRRGVEESFRLHLREGFDATFPEDRLTGANWAIFEAALIAGLQASHPDIMAVRGGLAWAVREPLYPFRIGEYHAPRHRPRIPVDLRLVGHRAAATFAAAGGDAFAAPEFSYLDWVLTSRWEDVYLDAGPLTAVIEPSSICAGSCLHCPQPHLHRSRGSMSLPVFERIVAALESAEGLRWVFSGMGEPLENPDLMRMAAMLGEKHVTLYTSLNREPPADLRWEPFDLVRISLDALEAEGFRRNRPGCSWERIERFLAEASARKSAAPEAFPEIGISFLKHRDNDREADAFLRYGKRICSPVFRKQFFTWPTDAPPQRVQWYQILGVAEYLGAVAYAGVTRYTPLNRRPCLHALLGVHVLQDGTVARCPYDTEGTHGWGAIPPEELLERWNGDAWKRFRREHLGLTFDASSPCRTCPDWYHRG
ncbi:MAG TPA: radical SAM protein [Candidatus Ozemobacteraceae bacterium]|nr:radical SAM protein [Candidatus Ozemobacteraceae bacterium]